MSQRSSAVLWLVMGLFCAFLALASCGGGGWGLWHTQNKLEIVEKSIDQDTKLLEQKNPKDVVLLTKLDDAEQRRIANDKEKAELDRYKIYALSALGISLLPALMTPIFLIMFFITWRKKPRVKVIEVDDDEEEEEEAEPPPAKKKPAAKRAAEDDD
jgi:hypothetical protein